MLDSRKFISCRLKQKTRFKEAKFSKEKKTTFHGNKALKQTFSMF